MATNKQSVCIPISQVHSLENPSKVNLGLIKVQSGSYLVEGDLECFAVK